MMKRTITAYFLTLAAITLAQTSPPVPGEVGSGSTSEVPASPTLVKITISRGDLTNQQAVATLSMLEMEPSMFYEIEASGMDLQQMAIDGTNNLPDFSCVTTNRRPATLIAPDLAVGCAHYTYAAGQTITFGGQSAIVKEVVYHPDYVFGTSGVHDITFIILDRNLTIQPALVAPQNWRDWTGAGYIQGVAFIRGLPRIGTVMYDSLFKGAALIVYDSGSPIGLSIDGRFVLIGIAHGSNFRDQCYFNGIEPLIDVERHFQEGVAVMPYVAPEIPEIQNGTSTIWTRPWILEAYPTPLEDPSNRIN